MAALYNENDRHASEWIRHLAAAGAITAGTVDSRSIADLVGADVDGYERAHFFAGIAGWEEALRLAEWPKGREVWTGSCPCQPFSSAGKRGGHEDERHLWPAFYRLIAECRPATIFGEQVASGDGRLWLAAVRADLEALGYAVGAADLCAAGAGAPHIRQRLWWGAIMADPQRGTAERHGHSLAGAAEGGAGALRPRAQRVRDGGGDGGDALPVADSEHAERGPINQHREDGRDGQDGGREKAHGESGTRGEVFGTMGYAALSGGETRGGDGLGDANRSRGNAGFTTGAGSEGADDLNPWAAPEWLPCLDGKARPTQPGVHPLAHGVPGRVVKLRAYGNAIVPQVAARFIRAFLAAELDGRSNP